jgi:hypothetical protein
MSSSGEVNPRAVLVVHGRNLAARSAVFHFLRVVDLRPLEWNVLAGQTRSGSPFVLEILERAFEIAQAIVVILTPDESAILNPALRTEPGDDRSRRQPRPNVLFEAGMAFMHDRKRTILLEFGSTDMLSDLHGVHTLRIQPGSGAEMRKEFVERLSTAGCRISTEGSDWLSTGDFEAAFLDQSHGARTEADSVAGSGVPFAVSTSAASRPHPGNTSIASGARSVSVGGDASGSISTGDREDRPDN